MARRLAMRMDRLYATNLDRLRKGIFRWVHAQHNELPEDTVIAATATFLLLCERYKLEPRRVLEVGQRVLRDAQDKQPTNLRAMKLLLEGEMPDA